MIEDYPKESRETISILSETLNSFMNDVINAVNGNINFDNLNMEYTSFKVFTDANGNPVTEGGTATTPQIRLGRSAKVVGVHVINATNLSTTTNYPTASPFISYTTTSNVMKINNIKGLQANEKHQLTILIIYAT